MVIERNIIKKVGEYNNIAICDERTVRIELTEAEIEEAYRIREREYLEEDIKNAIEEFCDYWGIPKGIAGGLNDNPDIICKIASLYEKNQDTMGGLNDDVAAKRKVEDSVMGVAIEAEMQGFIYGFKVFEILLNRELATA